MIDENVKNFFETHNSAKILTLPEMTPEELKDLSTQIRPILIQSPILMRVFTIKGLKKHRDSMNTLLSCVYHLKCEHCGTPPVIFEVAVFHPEGVTNIFDDKTVSVPPPVYSWPILEGFHFLVNCRCPKCEETFFTIATYQYEVGQFINSYALSAAEIKDSHKEKMGFIVRYSWMNTYFEKKEFDKKFIQKTTLACIKCYHDLKKAPASRHMSSESFYMETGQGIIDVIRNLIPQITTEIEFCGLIKGVHFFNMIEAGDRIFQFESLNPSVKQFSFTRVQQEFKIITPTIPNKEKKAFLAAAISSVDTAYQLLTSKTIPMPKWVTAYLEESSR